MTDQAPELLPCPFCGKPPISKQGEALFTIRCMQEGCRIADVYANTPDKAAARWNTRPTPSEPVAQVRDDALVQRLSSDEGWQTAVNCAWECLGHGFDRKELDNAMQHAFGILALQNMDLRALTSERPSESAVAREPVKKYADTFSAVSVIKEMFFPHARSDRETIAEAIYFSQRGRLVDQGGVTAQRPWRDNSIPDTFWNHFLADADAVLALPIQHGDAVRAKDEPALVSLLKEVDPRLASVLTDNAAYVRVIRSNVIKECAKIAERKFAGTLTSNIGLLIAEAIRAISPTLASERVQATSGASVTACDHLTTEKAMLGRIALKIAQKISQLRHYRDNDAQLDHAKTIADGRISQAEMDLRWVQEELRAANSAGQVIANQENLLGSEPEPTLASERVSERTGLQPSKE